MRLTHCRIASGIGSTCFTFGEVVETFLSHTSTKNFLGFLLVFSLLESIRKSSNPGQLSPRCQVFKENCTLVSFAENINMDKKLMTFNRRVIILFPSALSKKIWFKKMMSNKIWVKNIFWSQEIFSTNFFLSQKFWIKKVIKIGNKKSFGIKNITYSPATHLLPFLCPGQNLACTMASTM